MNKELIERLAREAGLIRSVTTFRFINPPNLTPYGESLSRFAALVADECAKACVGLPTPNYLVDMDSWQSAQEDISAAIRAKFPMP